MLLRQRRRPQKPVVTDTSTPANQQQPLLIRAEELLLKSASSQQQQQQRPKYPRVSAAYPRIAPSVKNRASVKEEVPARPKKAFLPPPSCRPPTFLKCTSIRQDVRPESGEEPLDEEGKEEEEDEEKKKEKKEKDEKEDEVRQTTDLDIQFQEMKLDNLTSTSPPAKSKEKSSSNAKSNSRGQSLLQYCNFDEKKVVKVAPHIRGKDVICDTVDAWSRQSNAVTNLQLEGVGMFGRPRYRPLVFGGTYPIDAPFAASEGAVLAASKRKNDDYGDDVNSSRVNLSVRRTPKTFDIDEPVE